MHSTTHTHTNARLYAADQDEEVAYVFFSTDPGHSMQFNFDQLRKRSCAKGTTPPLILFLRAVYPTSWGIWTLVE